MKKKQQHLTGLKVSKSMTIKEPINLMGPDGLIIATISSYNDGTGIALDFECENVEVKANGEDIDGNINSLTVNLLE